MQHTTSMTQPKRRPVTLYLAFWAVLACSAIIYLAVAAARPDLIAGPIPWAAPETPAESNEGQRAMSQALDDVKALKESVAQVQSDVAGLKTENSEQSEQDRQLASRVVALEVKPQKTAFGANQAALARAAAAAKPAAPAVAPVAAAGEAFPSAGAQIAAPAPAAKGAAIKVLNATPSDTTPVVSPQDPLITGSVAAPPAGTPVVFGTAVVKPAAKPVGIQIGTGPSVDALRLSWSLLSEKHGDSLKSLQPRYVTGADATGTKYDLVAGPVKSAADAKRICKALEASAVPCKIGAFKGDAL